MSGFFGGGGGSSSTTRASLGEVYARAHGSVDFDPPNAEYSLPSGNYKQIGFNYIDADPYSTLGDESALYGSNKAITFTAPFDGLYLFILSLGTTGADAEGYCSFTINGGDPNAPTAQVIFSLLGNQAVGQGITNLSLSSGDVVRFYYYNNSSGNVNQNQTQQYWNIAISRSGL
jgi:hypothetical protein